MNFNVLDNTICPKHKFLPVSHICTYKQCEIKTRNCCSECIKWGIHSHQMPNFNHIMEYKTFQTKIKNKQLECLNNQQQKAIKNEQFLWQLNKNLQKLSKQIDALQHDVEIQLKLFSRRLQYQEREDFEPLDYEAINKLINIDYQFDFSIECIQDPLNKIQQQINKELQNLKDLIENQHDILDSRKYEIQQFRKHEKFQCSSGKISNDDKYLVYNNKNVINVYDIKLNKMSKTIFKSNKLTSFGFTFDSQCLFAGNEKGFVYGFLASNDFKQFFQQKLHWRHIREIKIIQNYIIAGSVDGTIIKTDFITKHKIFQFKISNSCLHTLFEYDQQKNILISASYNSINIWDCQNQTEYIYYDGFQNEIKQFQFVNNTQIVCSDDQGNLFKFKIDHQNKQLVRLAQYYYNCLIGFQLCNNDQNLLLIFEQDFIIIDNEGRMISTIFHCLKLDDYYGFLIYSLNQIVLYNNRKYKIIIIARIHLFKALK